MVGYHNPRGYVVQGNQLCIPKISMRENFIKKKHSGELARYFGQDKTIALLLATVAARCEEVCAKLRNM